MAVFWVTDKPNSPHLLAPKIKARLYFAIAADDDKREPEVTGKLREAFATAKVRAEQSTPMHCTAGACPTARRPRIDGTPSVLGASW
jgi:carboxymethylenebutenolidase